MQYWLMKSEPNEFSISDLKNMPNQTEHWDGVRNYQARNFMRDQMKTGDQVFFYHSRIDPSIVGTAKVVREGYPDFTAWDKDDPHFDPKTDPDNPRWFMVDIQFESELPRPLPLPELRTVPGLENMMLLKKGSRLSVQPVSAEEYQIILDYAHSS